MRLRIPWLKPKPPPPVADHRAEAERAVQQAEEGLRKAKRDRARSDRIVRALEEIRRKNDFAHDIKKALGDTR